MTNDQLLEEIKKRGLINEEVSNKLKNPSVWDTFPFGEGKASPKGGVCWRDTDSTTKKKALICHPNIES